MNSTSPLQIDGLTPPLPNLFEDMVEEAVLAYQMRQRSLQQGVQSVRALAVLERPIESMLACARYYGGRAQEAAAAFQRNAKARDKEAVAFVATAIRLTLNCRSDTPATVQESSKGGNLDPANCVLEGAACNLSAGNRGAPTAGMSCAERGGCGAPYGRID